MVSKAVRWIHGGLGEERRPHTRSRWKEGDFYRQPRGACGGSMWTLLVGLLGLVLLGGPGCWFVTTKREGRALRARVRRLEERLDALKAREEAVRKSIEQARAEQKKLAELMEQARKVFLRNSADVGARVEMLMEKIGTVLGRLDSAEHELKALSKEDRELKAKLLQLQTGLLALRNQLQAVVTELTKRPKEPETADELWQAAAKAASDPVRRARYLRRFLGRYPTDPRAEEAQYLLAEAYFQQNKFAAAELMYKRYVQRYPKGRFAAKAWLKRARCHYELKYCRSALAVIRQMLKRVGRAPEAVQARRLAARIRRQLHNIRYCER